MPGPGPGGREDAARAAASGAAKTGSVSYLDHGLWRQFRQAETIEAFVGSWLALQCRMIAGVLRGVVVLGEPEEGPFAPVAFWPAGETSTPGLAAAAEMAMAQRRGVVRPPGDDDEAGRPAGGAYNIAYPFIVDDRLYGVVAIEVDDRPKAQIQPVVRQLQWGSAWIESTLRRQQSESEKLTTKRVTTALDLVATALEEDRYLGACTAVVTELATRLDCERVSIGFVRRGHTAVVALSHSAQVGKRMNLMRAIGTAMDEAGDQGAAILYPAPEGGEIYATRAHAELAQQHGAGSILTVPFAAGDETIGAIAFERPPGGGFEPPDVAMCECAAAVIGPILDAKRRNDRLIIVKLFESLRLQLARLIGPRHLGRKLAAAVVVGFAVFFSVATGDYRVTAPTTLEGVVQRAIVAPFDGYVLSAAARPGDVVEAGALLAELDDTDLALERVRWTTERRQRLVEYDQALADHERAEINIIRAKLDQAAAQIALLDEHLARAKLVAPFTGVVVSGDLSQSIGAPVQRGDLLFEVAPLDAYRVIIKVDEREIADIAPGQTGALLVSSMPDDTLPFVIDRITPVSEAREGRNYFRVEARLDAGVDTARLRPGMEGVSKIMVGERRLSWIWTYQLIDWARLWFWTWVP